MRTRFSLTAGLLIAACSTLSACGPAADEAEAAADAGTPDASESMPGEDAEAEETDSAASKTSEETTEADDAAASPAETAPAASKTDASGLSAYVGKWPFDEVNGLSWNEHPAVRAGVRKTVSDAAARDAVLNQPGPSAEITTYAGKVASWSCQVHNCGDHQWMVMVDPKSGATDVCYYNAAVAADQSRWFLAGGTVDTRPGNCTVE